MALTLLLFSKRSGDKRGNVLMSFVHHVVFQLTSVHFFQNKS